MTEKIIYIEVPIIQKELKQEQHGCILLQDHGIIPERKLTELGTDQLDRHSPRSNFCSSYDFSNPPKTPMYRSEASVYCQLVPVLPSDLDDTLEKMALLSSEESKRNSEFIKIDSVSDNDKEESNFPVYGLDCLELLTLRDINPTVVLEKLTDKVIEEVKDGIWRCDACGKLENSFLILGLHKSINCEEVSQIECDTCQIEISGCLNFVAHCMEHEMGRERKCPICLSGNILDMKQHLIMQGHYVPRVTELDSQTNVSPNFSQKSVINTSSHTPITRYYSEKMHECHICKVSFSSETYLRLHQRIHSEDSEEKPFECKICLKVFSGMSTLNKHIRSHSDERPYKCLVCIKSFKEKGGLKRHINTVHSDQKPLRNISTAHFTANYKTIVERSCSEKLHECDICEKKFSSKETVREHKKIHSGEKSFECSTCGRLFTYKQNMKKHEKIHW